MLVQRVFDADGGETSWTVLDDHYAVLEPVDVFLAHLTRIERSPTTVLKYAFDFCDYFTFLHSRQIDSTAVVLEDLGRFLAWLRLNPDARRGTVAHREQ
jgi:hypothetical protein